LKQRDPVRKVKKSAFGGDRRTDGRCQRGESGMLRVRRRRRWSRRGLWTLVKRGSGCRRGGGVGRGGQCLLQGLWCRRGRLSERGGWFGMVVVLLWWGWGRRGDRRERGDSLLSGTECGFHCVGTRNGISRKCDRGGKTL
jgi:hypothetical protein